MRTIYLSAGHSNVVGQDRGASGCKLVEGNLTVDFRRKLIAELQLQGITPKTDPDENITVKTVSLFKGMVGLTDIALDIHFNAGPPTATGCEVIIPQKYTRFEFNVAANISSIISRVLEIRNRGVLTEDRTPHKKLAWMAIPCENILMEICFISNMKDMEKYNNKDQQLANNLATYLKTVV